MSRSRRLLCASALILGPIASPALAEAPRVAVDIAPIHSIVAAVMAGVGAPELVLPPGASPHHYSLRPSNAAALDKADLVVWIGPDLSPWMAGPVAALAHASVLELETMPGVTLLPVRAGGPFEVDTDESPAVQPGEDRPDGHLWLDPENAKAIAAGVADRLAEIDPADADRYRENTATFATRMTALEAAINNRLAPVRGRRFIVFHDAYQYFEHRFDIPAAGSIELGEAEAPSAARIAAIRDRVRREDVVCAFTEPQFEPKLLATVTEGTDMRIGELDPDSGIGLPVGADLYPAMLLAIATNLSTCLAG